MILLALVLGGISLVLALQTTPTTRLTKFLNTGSPLYQNVHSLYSRKVVASSCSHKQRQILVDPNYGRCLLHNRLNNRRGAPRVSFSSLVSSLASDASGGVVVDPMDHGDENSESLAPAVAAIKRSFSDRIRDAIPPANERQKVIPLALMFFCELYFIITWGQHTHNITQHMRLKNLILSLQLLPYCFLSSTQVYCLIIRF